MSDFQLKYQNMKQENVIRNQEEKHQSKETDSPMTDDKINRQGH